MQDGRVLLVEFACVVAVVVLAMGGIVMLSLAGHDSSQAANSLTDVVKVGFGAVVALAYAARGKSPDGGG